MSKAGADFVGERFTIIGSNSFSGSHCVDELLRQGCEVQGISRSLEPAPVFLPYLWNGGGSPPRRFAFRNLDLNGDASTIAEEIKAFRPDYVINFAAQGMVAESWQHPTDWYQTNVVANVRLHESLRRLERLKKYVHVSTPEVYGNTEGVISENTQYCPSTPYAASRAACDLHLVTFYQRYRFPVVFTRSANVFGPGQRLYRIVPKTILSILLDQKLPLHGGGYSLRSFIHVRDMVAGTLAAARRAEPPEIFHFSTERRIWVRQLVEMIAERMGTSFSDLVEQTEDRPGKDKSYALDVSNARQKLGWSARIALEKGLDETISWVRTHLQELKNQPQIYVHQP